MTTPHADPDFEPTGEVKSRRRQALRLVALGSLDALFLLVLLEGAFLVGRIYQDFGIDPGKPTALAIKLAAYPVPVILATATLFAVQAASLSRRPGKRKPGGRGPGMIPLLLVPIALIVLAVVALGLPLLTLRIKLSG